LAPLLSSVAQRGSGPPPPTMRLWAEADVKALTSTGLAVALYARPVDPPSPPSPTPADPRGPKAAAASAPRPAAHGGGGRGSGGPGGREGVAEVTRAPANRAPDPRMKFRRAHPGNLLRRMGPGFFLLQLLCGGGFPRQTSISHETRRDGDPKPSAFTPVRFDKSPISGRISLPPPWPQARAPQRVPPPAARDDGGRDVSPPEPPLTGTVESLNHHRREEPVLSRRTLAPSHQRTGASTLR